jgi:hypothetical protein
VNPVLVTIMDRVLIRLEDLSVVVHLALLVVAVRVTSMSASRIHARKKELSIVSNWSMISTAIANLAIWAELARLKSTFVQTLHASMVASVLL